MNIGYFYFIDRSEKAFGGGKKTFRPRNRESRQSHPKVLESAAVAVPSDLGEDDIMLFCSPAAQGAAGS